MDISQIDLKRLPRELRFEATLEVVDCIDYDNPKVIFSIGNLRNTFLSIFPDRIFKEDSFRFFFDSDGTRIIMQVHNLHTLSEYIEDMSHMRYLGINWQKIHDEMKNNHTNN